MIGLHGKSAARRRFLQFLAGSPLLAMQAPDKFAAATAIKGPQEAINVFDLLGVALRVVPPAHLGNLQTGVVGDATLRANEEAFRHIQLRARRLVDIQNIDLTTEVFGVKWATPVLLSPCGQHKALHPEGEIATARGARKGSTLLTVSTVTTCPLEDVAREAGQPVWYQLYATNKWEVTERLVRRAENAGCPVLVLTIDMNAGRSVETFGRMKRLDPRPCKACHGPEPTAFFKRKPMFDGIDMTGVSLHNPAMTWEFVDRLRKLTHMKLVLKGIVTGEDAALCLQHGVDGILVSNHGGRAEESGRATLESLPEVLDKAGGRIPVLLDGGIRRGTDILKALAMGATAVGIGRPYLWGLAAFGQAGVERVIEILRDELKLIMAQCGVTSIAAADRGLLAVREIPPGWYSR